MNLDLLQNLQANRNRLLRAGTQLLTVAPGDPVIGETLFFDSGASTPLKLAVYDGVSQGTPASTWRIFAGLNRNDSVNGLWTWDTQHRGTGTANGERAPFVLGTECAFDSGFVLSNRVANLNADLVDGRHAFDYVTATSAPPVNVLPVYGAGGLLGCGDPVNDYDCVNKKTLLAAATGLLALAPCKAATAARLGGTRSGNVITASSPGLFIPDGVSVGVGDRVLMKNQGDSGNSATDNGIYTVTTNSAGTNTVLTRASDVDATGELTVGALVFIEQGTTNIATQWSCQRPAGVGGGSVIVINTDSQLWQKTFQQSAYTAGRGLVLNGLEFNFSQNVDYTVGAVFAATGARTIGPVQPPASIEGFLYHPGTASTQPHWAYVSTALIEDWPNPILPGSPMTAKKYARFNSTAGVPGFWGIEDSNLQDITGAVIGWANTTLSPTVALGDTTHPFSNLWTSALRLKPTAGAGTLLNLWGTQDNATDGNTDHKQAVVWGAAAVKAWLGVTVVDVGGVPASRTITMIGDGITIAPPATKDLSSNQTWMLGIDWAALESQYVTLTTAQSITGTKKWYSPSSSASTSMIEVAVLNTGNPNLRITAGGEVLFGDTTTAPAGSIGYANGRITVSGKEWEFSATSIVRMTSAISVGGAPTYVLGLNATDQVRKVAVGDLVSFTGLPLLTVNAVGYGDAGGRLAGDPSNLRWDYTNFRLGIKQASPTAQLDIEGNLKCANTLATGAPAVSYPGALVTVSDTSTSAADWTNRFLYGAYIVAGKSGTATLVTLAEINAVVGHANLSAGSVTSIRGIYSTLQIGAASSGPTVTNAIGFYSGFASAAGSAGTISRFYHFYGANIPAAMPQPLEVYGIQLGDYSSATGAVRTAGARLDIGTTGVGERYNIYAPGAAPSYFAGNLGLGVTTPTVARLEFVIGTTTLAPVRFASTSALTSLLTTPLAGVLESRGDRLMFTDGTPTRHALAYFDDLGFSNDIGAVPAGGVAFDFNAHMVATMDTVNPIGQNDFTLWARFKVPPTLRGPTAEGVCAVAGGNTAATSYNAGTRIQLNVGGLIMFYVSTDASNWRAIRTSVGAFAIYGGKVIDVVCVRKGSAQPLMYINGVAQTGLSETTFGTVPAWDMAVTSSYLHAGNDFTNYGSVPEIYRVAFFNYGMTATEVGELCRNGHTDVADKWGQTTNITMVNPGFETFAAGVPTGWVKGAAAGMTTTDEAVDFHGGLHCCRFTGGGPASATTSNWLSQTVLALERRHLLQAWVKRISGTGALNFGNAFQLQASIGVNTTSAASWTPISVQGKCGGAYGNQQTISFAAVAGDVWLLDDVTAQQVGAVAEMDFGVGCGAVIPDMSGRYPGTMTGGYRHVIPTCPTEVTQGPGTVARNLRRYTQIVSAKDNDTVTVTHSLGTLNITVAVWNAAGASVAVAVNRKAGSETNAVELGFALVGSPSVLVNFTVVIIG